MATDIDRARGALHAIPPNLPRDDWHRVGRSAIAAGLPVDDVVEWSRNAPNFKSEQDVRAAFRTITPDGGTGPGTLFQAARDAGWTDNVKPHAQRPAKAAVSPAEPLRKPAAGMGADEVFARGERVTNAHGYVVQKAAAGVPLDGLRVLPADDALRIRGESMASALAVAAYGPDGALQSL